MELSAEERQWLTDHADQLILAPTPDYPPMEIIDENGRFTGYAGDLFRRIEELLGIRFKIVNLKTWDAIVQAGKQREIALTSLAQKTTEREAFWNFTTVFLEVPTIIITGKKFRGAMTLESLKGLKVGYVKSFAVGDFLKIQVPDLPLRVVEENTIGLRMVALGELDALITELPSAVYLIERDGLTGLRVAGETGFRYRYSIASRNDWPILNRLLQRAIDAIPQVERQEIYQRWIRLQVEPALDRQLVGGVLAIIVFLLALVVAWNRSLQHQVRRRTAEIERALTELRQTEKELRRHEERFRTIVTSAPFAIAIIRLEDGVYLEVNPSFERVTGIASDWVLGRKMTEVLTPEEREQSQLVLSLLRRDGRVDGIENSRIGPDGNYRYFLNTVCLMELQGESCILSVTADVTETKRLELELHQVQKMEIVGQMVGGIAHDFNNMLTGIMGQADLLARKVQDPAHVEMAQTILQGSKRAADLTRKLLSFSRKGGVTPGHFDLHDPLKAAIALLEHSIDPRISIEQKFTEQPLMLFGDVILLQNAFLNLGINARDAMPEGGTITFASSTVDLDEADCRNHPFQLTPGKHALISVRDSGSGISPAVLPRIFDPFFTTKESGKGTGLGLSMVFNTVKNHHGAIQVKTEIGVGSEFRILLPLAPAKA